MVRSVMPEGEFTESALRVHGLSRKVLKKKGAKVFTKATSDMIMNYLNIMKDLPIVAHNVEHDRDKVLMPAFKKVGNLDALPPDSRWRCTQEMANRIPFLNMVTLDDALEHFGHERRDVDKHHDALEDARLAAKVYMSIMAMPEMKKGKLGFKWNWMAEK